MGLILIKQFRIKTVYILYSNGLKLQSLSSSAKSNSERYSSSIKSDDIASSFKAAEASSTSSLSYKKIQSRLKRNSVMPTMLGQAAQVIEYSSAPSSANYVDLNTISKIIILVIVLKCSVKISLVVNAF